MRTAVLEWVGRYYFLLVILGISSLILRAHIWARGFPPEVYAQTMAAASGLAAVVVALVIAVRAAEESRLKDAKRAAAAAILISQNLYDLRAILDVVDENRALVCADPEGYAHWLSRVMGRILGMGQVIENDHLQIVTDLPTLDLYTLAVTDSWFKAFKRRSNFRDGMTVAEVVDRFDATMKELAAGGKVVRTASERMFALSEVGESPPWARDVPPWVRPERIA